MRVTIQGETIEQHFGLRGVAVLSLERYSSATLLTSLHPPVSPSPLYRSLMEQLSRDSCAAYRSVVFNEPQFVPLFHAATPVTELGMLNIGSRPARRNKGGGVETLRAIPWIFGWTQTRFMLPVWLGVGQAIQKQLSEGNGAVLTEMLQKWPFFQSTMNLVEMVLLKTDLRISHKYFDELVPSNLQPLAKRLENELESTLRVFLNLTGKNQLLDSDPVIRRAVEARHPFLDPLNIVQVRQLKVVRAWEQAEASGVILTGADQASLRLAQDTLAVSVQGIAAGLQNTG